MVKRKALKDSCGLSKAETDVCCSLITSVSTDMAVSRTSLSAFSSLPEVCAFVVAETGEGEVEASMQEA